MLPLTHNKHHCFKQQLQSSSQPTVFMPEPFFFLTSNRKKLKADSGVRVCSSTDGGEGGRHHLQLRLFKKWKWRVGEVRKTNRLKCWSDRKQICSTEANTETNKGKTWQTKKKGKQKGKRAGLLRAAAALEYCTSDTVPTFYRRASKLTLKKPWSSSLVESSILTKWGFFRYSPCFYFASFKLSVTFSAPSRYPPVGRPCHRRHGGRGSDLQLPLHRHLRLQLGPAGRRGWVGWAPRPDRAGPSAGNSQRESFISELKLLSVRQRTRCPALRLRRFKSI